MFLSMSRHIEAAEAARILQAITDEHPVTQDDVLAAMAAEGPTLLPPPVPPTVMTLRIYEGRTQVETYVHVTQSAMVAPTVFRIETEDGRIVLLDMVGRDFVLVPE